MFHKLLLFVLSIFPGLPLYAQQTSSETAKRTPNQKADPEPKLPIPVYKDRYQNCSDCVDHNTVMYDFKCKRFFTRMKWISKLSDVKLNYNQEVHFRVANINRYVYDIDFAADDVQFGSQQPEIFSQLFLGQGT